MTAYYVSTRMSSIFDIALPILQLCPSFSHAFDFFKQSLSLPLCTDRHYHGSRGSYPKINGEAPGAVYLQTRDGCK